VPADVVPSGTSRTVLVEFTVLTDGQVTDVHAVFGSHPLLNETAENAVKKSPKWQSAEHNGEKMSTRMTIPVVFSME
jgi:TonB family protein